MRGSICARCVPTSGRHQGHRSLFSKRFHLVRRGTPVPDGLPLEYSWPGARGSPSDLLASLPSSILQPHLRSRGTVCFCQVCLIIPTETHRTRDSVCVCIVHRNANTREARYSHPTRVSCIATCPLLNI